MFKNVFSLVCLIGSLTMPGLVCAETVGVFFNSSTTNDQFSFAANDVKAALETNNYTVEFKSLAQLNTYTNKKVVIGLVSDSSIISVFTNQGGTMPGALGEQAYALRTTTQGQTSYWVLGGDTNGAMYGGLQIAENISFNGFSASYTNQETPFLLSRGMKLNLPLDKRIPTYVGGWSSYSARYAITNVWDMTFWKTLIDQQARSRYNLLSVWVHHPFPALVSVPEYPNACLPDIQRYDGTTIPNLNINQRVAFWRAVMQYAHDRGMKFYFFNWNIYVDYASTQYPALTTSASNPTTIDYMNKSMKALLATYPELDGFGITTGDGMSGTAAANTQWSWDAYGKATYDYLTNNPSRRFNLIHRGVGTDPATCYSTYASLLGVTNATFNTSAKYALAHMYSAPAPTWTGDINTCFNLGQKTFITVRNDDYFYINWGDPKFVRDFMTGIPHKDTTVVGMYIGSDGYNPSRTYFCKDASQNGQLEVQRRWYMEMLWGRLSYNTNTSDTVINNLLARHYALASPASTNLFNAWSLASRSLPKVTELIMKDWNLDFHWYPEACYSDPGRGTGFRTISAATGATGGFAGQDVANGSSLCNISNSAAGTCGSRKSSYQLADEMEADAGNALALINPIQSGGNAELQVAINNVKQMAYLSAYYAHKIRGATYNLAGQTNGARTEMGQAYNSWIAYSQLMDATYYGDSFRNLAVSPDWHFADASVLKEYTDLGGVGIPNNFTLTTSATNGSIALNPLGGNYTTGTVVTVTANPNVGYAFANWSGNLTGSTNPATITMNTNKSVTANFISAPTYTLTTSATNGSITLNPSGGIYNTGTVVTVTANPNAGYAFTNWSGNLSGSANPTTITMNGNKSVTANFRALLAGGQTVLFVVGSSASNPSDLAISNRLQSFGYTVQMILDSASTTANATGKGLVLVSSTVGSGNVTTKFRDVAVPVINWEYLLEDDFNFTTTANLGTAGSQTALIITNVGHPLAAGFPAGIRTVATVAGAFAWGEPGGSPTIIARLADNSHPCLYGYETGATMNSGTAPARRVNLFLQNDTFVALNADGVSLFDAAVSWAIGQTVPITLLPPVLQGGQLRLEWTGGTLQTATDLAGPWTNVSGASSPHLTPATNSAQFFRVKQ